MTLRFVLHSAGVRAPGVDSLAALHALRRSGRRAAEAALELPPPALLPANERRRASRVVRLTLDCAAQALRDSPFPAESLRLVCAADEGTGEVCQQMLESLATTRQVSPLLFHNSVHNAPAGYFSIAYRNRCSATSVSLGVDSFACGLLCAVTETIATGEPVLLLAYDPAMTEPLLALHPVAEPTAAAWVISTGITTPAQHKPLGMYELSLRRGSETARWQHPAWLPSAWAANSSARALAALSLLEQVATGLDLPYGEQILRLVNYSE